MSEQKDAVEAMYNQAVNTGTLDGQEEAMAEMAAQVGTTVEALATAREKRNAEAAKRIAEITAQQDAVAFEGNAGDHWEHPKH